MGIASRQQIITAISLCLPVHWCFDCKDNEKCSNLGEMACNYLNETMADVLDSVVRTEAGISSYELTIGEQDSEGGFRGIMAWQKGKCDGLISGSQQLISSGGRKLLVRLRVCFG